MGTTNQGRRWPGSPPGFPAPPPVSLAAGAGGGGGGGGGGIAVPTPWGRVYVGGNTDLPDNTWVALAFDTTMDDHNTLTPQHDAVVNNSRVYCRVAGLYLYVGMVAYGPLTNPGRRLLRLHVNGSQDQAAEESGASGGDWAAQQVTGLLPMSVGDYVELRAIQISGADEHIGNDFPWGNSLTWAKVA